MQCSIKRFIPTIKKGFSANVTKRCHKNSCCQAAFDRSSVQGWDISRNLYVIKQAENFHVFQKHCESPGNKNYIAAFQTNSLAEQHLALIQKCLSVDRGSVDCIHLLDVENRSLVCQLDKLHPVSEEAIYVSNTTMRELRAVCSNSFLGMALIKKMWKDEEHSSVKYDCKSIDISINSKLSIDGLHRMWKISYESK